jgi:DNA polymerase-1
VPGVGPKTALELIKKFGTVKEMYARLDAAATEGDDLAKLREKFGPFRKEAELSEILVTLERHAPIEMPQIEDLAPAEGTGTAAAYFEKMGFSTLLKRLLFPTTEEKPTAKPKKKSNDAQASLF